MAPVPLRPPRSLRQEYDEFIEQRIEEYKDTLPRDELLEIGDEAMAELQKTQQFQLTELVLTEQVDAIIRRRLKLPSFRRWRERHLPLRLAQKEPSHWGLAPTEPIVALADRVADGDGVLVVGAGDGAPALFLAARGALRRRGPRQAHRVLRRAARRLEPPARLRRLRHRDRRPRRPQHGGAG